jgi:hypothetical protein
MPLTKWSVIEKGVGFGGIEIMYICDQMSA